MKKGHPRLAPSLFLLLLATALGVSQEQSKSREDPKETQATGEGQKAARSGSEDAAYVIGPADVLDVDVWGEKDLTRSVLVRSDGKISMPLVGDVQAAGLTPMALAASIVEKLRKYVNQPRVTVTTTAMNSRRIYVVGEVSHPGPLILLSGMTVLQALASAGGLGPFANQKRIYVLRSENGRQVRFHYNYKEVLRGATEEKIELQPGDTIVVP